MAEKALDVALDLAEKHGAQVKLLHVLLRDKEPDELLRLQDISIVTDVIARLNETAENPAVARSAEEIMGAPNAPNRPVPDDVLQKIGAHVLGRAVARAKSRDVNVEVLEVADGPAAGAIAAEAKSQAADTIVMGMRGLGQIEALTFGSVSQEVCRSVECTCIAVH